MIGKRMAVPLGGIVAVLLLAFLAEVDGNTALAAILGILSSMGYYESTIRQMEK